MDDHQVLRMGFVAAVNHDAKTSLEPIVVVTECGTVDELLSGRERMYDVVALDMSLADSSRPGENVRRIIAAGYPVLVYSEASNAADLREALAAGASGVSRKGEGYGQTLGLVRRVAEGETIDNQDLAAAIDGDSAFVAATEFPIQERESLRLYAVGFTRTQVARKMNIAENTVATYIKRVRKRYEAAGRAARNKTDLYRRAVEDGILEEGATEDDVLEQGTAEDQAGGDLR
ncbi:LuxR C-terminal-related transcriptional regulator [Arthrobacter sp. 2MCAF14]|uniref:LuxR C-terminal-related transcriptional regulator n=1 Tax=Arthrobacter sp. 2MCAF14 TaxID=3232982 RepID=UPI003F926DF3